MITVEELCGFALFEHCDRAHVAFFARHSADVHLAPDSWIVHEGETPHYWVVISGAVEVLKKIGGQPQQIGNYGPGDGFGEVPLLLGSAAVAGVRATAPTRLARVDSTVFLRMLHEDEAFARAIFANMARRIAFVENIVTQISPVVCTIYGDNRSAACHEMRDFLTRVHVAYEWEERSGAECDVVFAQGPPLHSPTIRQLAERLGLSAVPRSSHYDVAVVGGGPSGLAAAVYGASEGLCTLLIDRDAPGGQAGMSSRIENYLGFPTGISGEELADRAFHQAQRFGADIVVAREVSALAGVTGDRRLTLENGETVLARAVVLAPGVTYRRLEADGCDALLNRGVYYGAAQSEAGSVTGRRVHVVGGGNSAGQAALYFAEYAESVTIVIRGGTLAETMSQYLIDRIGHTDNVAVLAHTEVTAVSGDGRADAVTLRTAGGETRTESTDGLFVFIGAVPRTQWLGDFVARDAGGFILTGAHARASGAWPLERDPYFLETTQPGVFAVGDARKDSIKRVAAGVGEGSSAIALAHQFLQSEAHA